MSETIIGIDLGTTNSEVAVVRDGAVQVLEIANGSKLLPSVVGLAEDGGLLVGEAARNQYVLYPERTVRSIQRAAELAKITLSDNPYAMLEEEYLLDKAGTPVHLSMELARADYEEMIQPFIDETLQAAHTALDGAGMSVSQLDEILLVGGGDSHPADRPPTGV